MKTRHYTDDQRKGTEQIAFPASRFVRIQSIAVSTPCTRLQPSDGGRGVGVGGGGGVKTEADDNNNNNVHLSCAHQRPERSHDTY